MAEPAGVVRDEPPLIGARVAAAASAVFWTFVFFGLIDLTVVIDKTPGFHASYVLETGWGVLYTFLVGVAFAALTVRPAMPVPPLQIALVGACLAITAVGSGSWLQLVPAVLLLLNGYGSYWLAAGRLRLRPGWYRPLMDPVLLVLTLLLVPSAVTFAGDMIAGYREGHIPTDDDTWLIDHWPTQAALSLALVVVALAVAAGVRHGWQGTAVCATCVVIAAGWLGAASVAYPGLAGSLGQRRGVELLGWAVVFAIAAGWRLAVARHEFRGATRVAPSNEG